MHTCKCIQIAYASWIHKHSHNIHIYARTRIYTYIKRMHAHQRLYTGATCACTGIYRVYIQWKCSLLPNSNGHKNGKSNHASSRRSERMLTLASSGIWDLETWNPLLVGSCFNQIFYKWILSDPDLPYEAAYTQGGPCSQACPLGV